MTKHRVLAILVYLLFRSFSLNHAVADDGILLTEEIQLKLGDAFMSEGEYYRAVTEYMKFLILFPGSKKSDYALFNMGMAYYSGDEHKKAAATFSSLVGKYGESPLAPAAVFQEALSYQRLEMPDKAGSAFDRLLSLYPQSALAPTALLGKSLLLLGGGDISGSRGELERFLAAYPDDPRRTAVREAITLLDQKGSLPRKSTIIAGTLSALIPGSGHIYAGHYGDGITSFFLNGLFIAGTVVAVRQENYAMAGVAGVIGLPFYLGNIYGAANAATKWNLTVRRDLQGRMAVALDYRF